MRISRFPNLILIMVTALSLAACSTVPLDHPKQPSEAITDTANTPLGEMAVKYAAKHDGLSGFYPLLKGLDALGIRLAMIDLAERSVDAQYFLMKPDRVGRLFADKLLDAADRGVRVRLLLDDIFTTVEDNLFIVMDQHPNIQVRLFNPVSRKGLYYANYLGNFKLANRRMHNKSFIVDNAFSVVGGRNIADEYFEILDDKEFSDFDMLAVGPVAGEVADVFDRYWNHKLAVPMEVFETDRKGVDLVTARSLVDARADAASESIYGRALASPLMQQVRADKVKLYPGPSEVVTDEPDKLLNEVAPEHQILVAKLVSMVNSAEKEVVIITPYFIPGKDGVELLKSVVAKGVRVVVITNSLASNNHLAVHGAYARYRKEIIEAGVVLYEARVDASMQSITTDDKTYDSMTLHNKGIIIDRRYTVAGSLNLDPRSIDLNTEFGLLVESEALAEVLLERGQVRLPSLAYRVTLNEKGKLRWSSNIDGVEVVETHEPQTSIWMRFKALMSRILPESQL